MVQKPAWIQLPQRRESGAQYPPPPSLPLPQPTRAPTAALVCHANTSPLASPQAVLPMIPSSSPLQLQSTIVRRGRQPESRRAPKPRATSMRDAVPEFGSSAARAGATPAPASGGTRSRDATRIRGLRADRAGYEGSGAAGKDDWNSWFRARARSPRLRPRTNHTPPPLAGY